MYLKYGTYTHEDNECSVVIEKSAPITEGGTTREIHHRWQIAGRLEGATQSALTTEIEDLETAYATNGKDLILYDNDGNRSAHYVLNRDTTDGVFITQPPSYPDGSGAEYSTWRNYTIVVEFTTTAEGSNLLSLAEAFTYQGNAGPTWGYLPVLVGPWQQQQFTQTSVVTVTQEGRATGHKTYPTPSNPIYPKYLLNPQRTIRREMPNVDSEERVVSWSYTMQLPYSPI
jgi:hypothetical protein